MRDRWYGDNRDLIKWGGIRILCSENKINKVLWVAYLRDDKWTKIRFNDHLEPLPDKVLHHFKSIRKNMDRLRNNIGLDIILVDDKINVKYSRQSRETYTKLICEYIKNNANGNKVVFLDPDTGIEPNRLEETHVSKKEVKDIWNSLKENDHLVFYQHRSFDTEWRDKTKQMLASICESKEKIKMWFADESINNNSAKLARDVVFYFIKKVA
jgi:hypothetical protein